MLVPSAGDAASRFRWCPAALIREIDERDRLHGATRSCPSTRRRSRRPCVAWWRRGVTAIAIAFLWSFKNPAHELRALEIIREVAPEVYVSCSHQVAPRMGEYERTVATVINSYIAPASAAYFRRAADRLHDAGLKHPLLIMQVSGGVLPANKAVEIPLTSLGSGPVGGIIGSLSLARQLGHKNIIATDMGGTSFEVGLIIDGEPLVGEEKIIDQYRYKLPQLETTSIACGGGSLARVDPHSRSIRVGPESAGADPGPVCYRRGGTEPTVTDADVVLGLLSADGFLGGRMPLDREAALRAVAALGEQVGLGPTRRPPASCRSTTRGRRSSSGSRRWYGATTRAISWCTPTAAPARCTPSPLPRSWGSRASSSRWATGPPPCRPTAAPPPTWCSTSRRSGSSSLPSRRTS